MPKTRSKSKNPEESKSIQFDMVRHRFAHYQPQAISTMSLTYDNALLAVARDSNSIEVWKSETFNQLVSIPGHKNIDIRNIHWVEPKNTSGQDFNILYYRREKNGKCDSKKRRLVTTGLNGMVTEWDL